MNVEIREVEGISVAEIEAAMSGPVWAKVGRRWNTGGGGFTETVWSLHTGEPASTGKFAPLVADSPSEGPVVNALTRAVAFNANRGGVLMRSHRTREFSGYGTLCRRSSRLTRALLLCDSSSRTATNKDPRFGGVFYFR